MVIETHDALYDLNKIPDQQDKATLIKAISNAVAATLDLGVLTERDKLLMQRKISKHGLGLSMEKTWSFSS